MVRPKPDQPDWLLCLWTKWRAGEEVGWQRRRNMRNNDEGVPKINVEAFAIKALWGYRQFVPDKVLRLMNGITAISAKASIVDFNSETWRSARREQRGQPVKTINTEPAYKGWLHNSQIRLAREMSRRFKSRSGLLRNCRCQFWGLKSRRWRHIARKTSDNQWWPARLNMWKQKREFTSRFAHLQPFSRSFLDSALPLGPPTRHFCLPSNWHWYGIPSLLHLQMHLTLKVTSSAMYQQGVRMV